MPDDYLPARETHSLAGAGAVGDGIMDDDHELFEERLRRLRTKRGMTAAQLGTRVQVNQQTVLRWEWGLRRPEFRMMSTLAHVLGVSLDYLVTGHESQKYQALVAAVRRVSHTDARLVALLPTETQQGE